MTQDKTELDGFALMLAALEAWVKYDNESRGAGHPAPDYALARTYREEARVLTQAAIAKVKGER